MVKKIARSKVPMFVSRVTNQDKLACIMMVLSYRIRFFLQSGINHSCNVPRASDRNVFRKYPHAHLTWQNVTVSVMKEYAGNRHCIYTQLCG